MRRRHACGYTLIELLVVMMVIGLMAGLALPNMQRLYDSVERDAQRQAAVGVLTGMAYRAYMSGEPVTLARGRQAVQRLANGADLPAGWQIELPEPITFNFLGICSGGKLKLIAPDGAEEPFQLLGPRCDVALPPAAL